MQMTVEKQGNMVDGISGISMYTSLCQTNMKALRHTAIKDTVHAALNHGSGAWALGCTLYGVPADSSGAPPSA